MPRPAGLTLRLLAFVLGLAAGPVSAAEIVLRDGGNIVARGELLGHDGRYYRLLGRHGEVTLDGTDLTCEGRACPAPDAVETVRISGEAAILDDVLRPLLDSFAAQAGLALSTAEGDEGRKIHTFTGEDGVAGRISVHPTSSAEGLADIVADAADLAVTIRPPFPRELAIARAAGRGDLSRPGQSAILGLDALVPVVAPQNPVRRIGVEELRGVLAGRIDDWSDLGGPAGPIALHLPDPRTGAGEAVAALLSPDIEDPGPRAHADLAALSRAVAADPGALGVTLRSRMEGVRALALSGSCGTLTEAAPPAIKTEDYPLTSPVRLVAPARRVAPFARQVVDYVTSPAAQPVIGRAGLVDQSPVTIPFAEQGARLGLAILSAEDTRDLAGLRRMVRDLSGRARLSLSFRFENASTTLDAPSASNVALLRAALDQGLFDGRDLLFAGFSDGQGPWAANRALSRGRAEAVRDAVADRLRGGGAALSVAAYGEALPMACDDTAWGRRINRRVEVWLD